MSRQREVVHVAGNNYLVARRNELGTTVRLIEKVGEWEMINPPLEILATSPAGCEGLALALQEMAKKLKKDINFFP